MAPILLPWIQKIISNCTQNQFKPDDTKSCVGISFNRHCRTGVSKPNCMYVADNQMAIEADFSSSSHMGSCSIMNSYDPNIPTPSNHAIILLSSFEVVFSKLPEPVIYDGQSVSYTVQLIVFEFQILQENWNSNPEAVPLCWLSSFVQCKAMSFIEDRDSCNNSFSQSLLQAVAESDGLSEIISEESGYYKIKRKKQINKASSSTETGDSLLPSESLLGSSFSGRRSDPCAQIPYSASPKTTRSQSFSDPPLDTSRKMMMLGFAAGRKRRRSEKMLDYSNTSLVNVTQDLENIVANETVHGNAEDDSRTTLYKSPMKKRVKFQGAATAIATVVDVLPCSLSSADESSPSKELSDLEERTNVLDKTELSSLMDEVIKNSPDNDNLENCGPVYISKNSSEILTQNKPVDDLPLIEDLKTFCDSIFENVVSVWLTSD